MRVRLIRAAWRRLAMASFAVEPSRLAPFLPAGCEPDVFPGGLARVSLVAFDFGNANVLGVTCPGLRDFQEVNLRCYARDLRTNRVGVVFIKEYVGSRVIAATAKLLCNERFSVGALRASRADLGDDLAVARELTVGGVTSRFSVTAGSTALPATPAEAALIAHRWGFNQTRAGRLMTYDVAHVPWRCHPVRSWDLRWDFGLLYGPTWEDLACRTPDSVLLVDGSEVELAVELAPKTAAEINPLPAFPPLPCTHGRGRRYPAG